MTNRLYMMIQVFLITLLVVSIEYLIFSDYLHLFVLINPLLLLVATILIHPKKINQKTDENRVNDLKRMAYSIDHDINTPLTKIIAHSERALHGETVSREAVEKALLHANQLKRVNADYLKLFNIMQNGDYQRDTIELVELLSKTIDKFVPILQSRQIDYQLELPNTTAYVIGNSDLLSEAFSKLMHVFIDDMPSGEHFIIALNVKSYVSEIVVRSSYHQDDIAEHLLSSYDEAILLKPTLSSNKWGLSLKFSQTIIENHRGLIDYASNLKGEDQLHINLPNDQVVY